ncbi:MAG: hypothetical protein CVV42_21180 [Candidatus Riflebacteria bacterium HGW-Riflebacteria-2]|jgi:hypothetical protein|nr:MAG: hypothetical protein CVV42_21180 [Candidatus Riflebacteria bacterium HGW-Riflebacteria-2]
MSKTSRKHSFRSQFSGEPRRLIIFSFENFDRAQSQTFEQWQQEGILADFMSKLHEFSNLTRQELIQNGSLVIYGDFPNNSDFYPPRHINPSVKWGRLRLSGRRRVAGYIENETFYIVFLDKDHKFYIQN